MTRANRVSASIDGTHARTSTTPHPVQRAMRDNTGNGEAHAIALLHAVARYQPQSKDDSLIGWRRVASALLWHDASPSSLPSRLSRRAKIQYELLVAQYRLAVASRGEDAAMPRSAELRALLDKAIAREDAWKTTTPATACGHDTAALANDERDTLETSIWSITGGAAASASMSTGSVRGSTGSRESVLLPAAPTTRPPIELTPKRPLDTHQDTTSRRVVRCVDKKKATVEAPESIGSRHGTDNRDSATVDLLETDSAQNVVTAEDDDAVPEEKTHSVPRDEIHLMLEVQSLSCRTAKLEDLLQLYAKTLETSDHRETEHGGCECATTLQKVQQLEHQLTDAASKHAEFFECVSTDHEALKTWMEVVQDQVREARRDSEKQPLTDAQNSTSTAMDLPRDILTLTGRVKQLEDVLDAQEHFFEELTAKLDMTPRHDTISSIQQQHQARLAAATDQHDALHDTVETPKTWVQDQLRCSAAKTKLECDQAHSGLDARLRVLEDTHAKWNDDLEAYRADLARQDEAHTALASRVHSDHETCRMQYRSLLTTIRTMLERHS